MSKLLNTLCVAQLTRLYNKVNSELRLTGSHINFKIILQFIKHNSFVLFTLNAELASVIRNLDIYILNIYIKVTDYGS